MIQKSLLDTDTLSFVMKREPKVIAREQFYKVDHPRLTISAFTRFEVERGLKSIGATRQLVIFGRSLNSIDVLPLDDRVLDQASDIYAILHRKGKLIKDGDILIAATAVVYGLPLVTNNTRHFNRIAGLTLDNWFV